MTAPSTVVVISGKFLFACPKRCRFVLDPPTTNHIRVKSSRLSFSPSVVPTNSDPIDRRLKQGRNLPIHSENSEYIGLHLERFHYCAPFAVTTHQFIRRQRNMVYHSSFVDEEGVAKACGCPLLPLKSHIKGPAPASDQDRTDIVDEAITFFRANVFFRNFDIKSSADKLLIYLTMYINVALKRLEGCRTLAEGTKAIINLGLEKVPVPGESGFPFPGLFPLPQSQQEAELLRNYLKQIREETSGRLLSVAYRPNGTPNKWWLAFAKRKFMNIIVP